MPPALPSSAELRCTATMPDPVADHLQQRAGSGLLHAAHILEATFRFQSQPELFACTATLPDIIGHSAACGASQRPSMYWNGARRPCFSTAGHAEQQRQRAAAARRTEAVPTPQRERHLDLASALLASPDASQACHPADAAAGEASQMRQCQEMLPPAKKLCRRVPSGGVGQAAELPAQARRGEKRSDPPEVIVARASFAVKLKGMKEPHVGTIALSESDSES
eukprot:TRINITY_DN14376_c0_g1_i1.p2 TRINITY_DN14376_c0_g1~~TRINITY_DN14376_c0_g1_i1.p2  ORF type:complete len:223 (-),score=47.60 TRINITY_DN14376_c0_g1_i1:146-814(-)